MGDVSFLESCDELPQEGFADIEEDGINNNEARFLKSCDELPCDVGLIVFYLN